MIKIDRDFSFLSVIVKNVKGGKFLNSAFLSFKKILFEGMILIDAARYEILKFDNMEINYSSLITTHSQPKFLFHERKSLSAWVAEIFSRVLIKHTRIY